MTFSFVKHNTLFVIFLDYMLYNVLTKKMIGLVQHHNLDTFTCFV